MNEFLGEQENNKEGHNMLGECDMPCHSGNKVFNDELTGDEYDDEDMQPHKQSHFESFLSRKNQK